MILLYQTEYQYQVLPKRVLQPAQVKDLRSLAKQAGLEGTAARG